MRFNLKGDFNNFFGYNRSSFNSAIKNNLINFLPKIQDVTFTNKSFTDFDFSQLKEEDFVYADPPYLGTDTKYNINWHEKEEKQLYNLLSDLNDNGIKFALSNVLHHNGKTNTILNNWLKNNNYNVHYLDKDYSHCSPQKKDKTSPTTEILVTNY